jgi:hypothetical protein
LQRTNLTDCTNCPNQTPHLRRVVDYIDQFWLLAPAQEEMTTQSMMDEDDLLEESYVTVIHGQGGKGSLSVVTTKVPPGFDGRTLWFAYARRKGREVGYAPQKNTHTHTIENKMGKTR